MPACIAILENVLETFSAEMRHVCSCSKDFEYFETFTASRKLNL